MQTGLVSDNVLVGVGTNPLASFTVISPEDDVYVDDCQSTRPLYCPGVYYIERTLPTIQDLLTQLQYNQSCSQLGPIDLPIPCDIEENQPENTIGKYGCYRYTCIIEFSIILYSFSFGKSECHSSHLPTYCD